MIHFFSYLFKVILMHKSTKSYENVWILSGTSDGPILAEKLLKLNYVVFVSVVSYKAGIIYPENNKLHIITRRMNNEQEIQQFITDNKIKYVVDATHPFAVKISAYLKIACRKIKKSIFRYERFLEINHNPNSRYIRDFKDIKESEIKNKNLLLAIGSRSLDKFANYYNGLGANVFGRIIATPESILNGFSSCINNSKLAILNPSKNNSEFLESHLCKHWKIDCIVCRDSGGYSQMIWEKISYSSQIKLFLLKRPHIEFNNFVFSNYDELIISLTAKG